MKAPDWYEKAVRLFAAGASQKAVSKALRIPVRTIRRHLTISGSALKVRIDQEKAQLATSTTDARAELLAKAMGVLEKSMDVVGRIGLTAARAVLSKMIPSAVSVQTEQPAPEPEILPVDAAKEVSLSLPAFADLARLGQLPLEAVEELRGACRAFLADDLKPRPPIDLEADRVEMVGSEAEETSSDDNGAGMIPVQH